MAKYYTNFCFQGFDPRQFHCTHAYLGQISNERVAEVKSIIFKYFTEHELKRTNLVFNKIDFFGENHNVRVLRLEDNNFDYHLELRDLLTIGMLEVQDFCPHVSTKIETRFEGVLDRYSLVKVDNKIAEEVLVIEAV
jgi:2'-5' RNA ligase